MQNDTLARSFATRYGGFQTCGSLLPGGPNDVGRDRSTVVQIETWLVSVRTAVENMATVDELNQAEAMLTAVAKRLKQLRQDAAETERVRILTFKRIGDLIGPAEQTGNNKHGRAGKPEIELENHNSIVQSWKITTLHRSPCRKEKKTNAGSRARLMTTGPSSSRSCRPRDIPHRARRNMTKGQLAMIVAQIFLKNENGGGAIIQFG